MLIQYASIFRHASCYGQKSGIASVVIMMMVQSDTNFRFTLLLANEQEEWHRTVQKLLEPQGVQTLSARSGREALHLIESTPVHLAVLDTQMPQLGGMQVIRLMREVQKAPPAVLLAQSLTTHLLHEALGMQVFSVLAKPVDFNVLLDVIARVLKRHYESRWPGGDGGELRRSIHHTGVMDQTTEH